MPLVRYHNHALLIATLLCVCVLTGALLYAHYLSQSNEQLPTTKNNTAMLILSPEFVNSSPIPKKYTCDGAGINPELRIEGAPEETKSFALIMDDPDAPHGTFTHWLIWNIDPKTILIKEESVPSGSVEGKNGSGRTGYIGPCPPQGTHHYHFVLYALDDLLNLPSGSDRVVLEAQLTKHSIAQAELVGIYSR